MATPSVVHKICLTKDSKDYECCDNSKVRTHFTNPRQTIGSCRFSCTSWCAVCENQVKSEYENRRRTTSEVLTNSYAIEGYGINRDRIHSSPFKVDYEFKKIPPSKYSTRKNILECRGDNLDKNDDFDTRTEKKCSSSGACGKNWLSTCASDVQERYIREVEVLRDRLRELRENLPTRVGDFTTNSNLNIGNLKLDGGSSKQKSSPSLVRSQPVKSDIKARDQKRGRSPDAKRNRQPEESEVFNLASVVTSLKRPRDGSPTNKDPSLTRKEHYIKGFSETFLKDLNSSLLLESEDDNDNNNDDGEDDDVDDIIESSEEELDVAPNQYNMKDVTIGIDQSLKMTSSSPAGGDHVIEKKDVCPIKEKQTKHLVNKIPGLHPSLRPSLFPNVPPYIRFSNCETREKDFPVLLQRALKWKLTTITPVVVRKVVTNSGYRLVRRSPEWCGTWGKHMKSICFKTLRENQKLNHFPGTFQIGRKDRLWRNLSRLIGRFGKKEFGFIPKTYILPQDNKILRATWEKSGGKAKWIIKPPASARGSGIKVVHKWSQIPKKIPLIVQKYISNPYLINGSKFDLRLYVLVTSFNPLRIYLYDNGLVRFASVKYSDDMNTLADRYMHLTNYSINKLSSQYTQNEDAEACQGHKWTIKTLWSYLEKSVDIPSLWESLSELVIKTMIGGENSISQLSWANLPSRYCSYELFGVDVLLDENLKPWLLEVNISPSLHSASPLDLAVKGPMVQDIMNIAGYHIPNKLSQLQQDDVLSKLGMEEGNVLCFDPRMYVIGLSRSEKFKQAHFSEIEDRDMYLDSILCDLTPDDVRHLIQYEDELTQLGNFEKIFPTTRTFQYQKFLESSRYYNMLFDAWENRYFRNRSAGIKLLETFCHQQIHLDISKIEKRRTQVCVSSDCITNDGGTDDSATDLTSLKSRTCSTNNNDDSTHLNQQIVN